MENMINAPLKNLIDFIKYVGADDNRMTLAKLSEVCEESKRMFMDGETLNDVERICPVECKKLISEYFESVGE